MLRPGFRIKLVAAMMSVVILATGASLFVAQRRVRKAYERLSDQQFRNQFERFTELQDARLSAVRERCLSVVTTSVRLRAAAEENDVPLLYEVAADELRTLDGNSLGTPRPTFFLFFDASGSVLTPPQSQPQGIAWLDAWRRESRRAAVHRTLTGSADQQVTVIDVPSTTGRSQLSEIVITRMPAVDGEPPLGALLLAFPAVLPGDRHAEATPADARTAGDLRFGIWSDGALYARDRTFSSAETAELTQALSHRLRTTEPGDGEFGLNLEGQSHRIVVQALTDGGPGTAAMNVPYEFGVYSLDESRRQQATLRRQILLLGSVALGGALALSLTLAHGLSVPIRELRRGTAEVRRGNFQIKVPVRSPDDLGELAAAFNEMTAGLELKERYRTILNSVADEQVARQLIEDGAALGGEVRSVSVLFCDIRGFTAHTENMAPRDIVDFLNEHMTALTAVVKTHHGVLDKFVGDLLMALFGAPVSRGSDALDGARSALGIIAERERLNQTSRHRLQVGIGLATGEVVAGCMGSVDRLNYTVIGERVNLASRLCSLAKPGQVVIDDITRAQLGDRAEVRPLPPVKLKGFSSDIQAYELIALIDEPSSSPAAP